MKFWQKIHSLPEEARKTIALFLIIAAAGALFLLWGRVMASRLAVISPGSPSASPVGETVLPQTFVPPAETPGTFSPTAGIIDSLKSLRGIRPFTP